MNKYTWIKDRANMKGALGSNTATAWQLEEAIEFQHEWLRQIPEGPYSATVQSSDSRAAP